jgi:CHAT domain-containing protein
LQKAKLKMIAEGKFANPYYWAPFVLIGDWELT